MQNSSGSGASGSRLVIPAYIQLRGALPQNDASQKIGTILIAIEQIYKENASNLSFQILYTYVVLFFCRSF